MHAVWMATLYTTYMIDRTWTAGPSLGAIHRASIQTTRVPVGTLINEPDRPYAMLYSIQWRPKWKETKKLLQRMYYDYGCVTLAPHWGASCFTGGGGQGLWDKDYVFRTHRYGGNDTKSLPTAVMVFQYWRPVYDAARRLHDGSKPQARIFRFLHRPAEASTTIGTESALVPLGGRRCLDVDCDPYSGCQTPNEILPAPKLNKVTP
jgi:hypothetical protein